MDGRRSQQVRTARSARRVAVTEADLDDVPPLRLASCHAYAVRRGGLGDVYLCRRDISPSEVAVKRLHDDIARIPGAAQAFVNECRTWMRLSPHPNVVTAISAHWAEPEPPLVVLESVAHSLRDNIRAMGLGLARAVEVGVDICNGMLHISRTLPGFVHQDLKPENILIDDTGRAKVTDFGLAEIPRETRQAYPQAEPESTGLVGTPAYMSPEQCLLLPRTATADIYSVGCVLWEVFTGRHPYPEAVTVEDFLDAHIRQAPDLALPRRRERGADQFRDLVERCLRKEPGERPPTFADVRDGLQTIARAQGIAATESNQTAHAPHDTQLQLAQGLVTLGEYDEGRRRAQTVYDETDLNSGKLWAATLIARSYSDEARIEDAAAWIRTGEGWVRDDVGPVIVGAFWNEAARASDDLRAAERLYRRAVDIVPDASIGWWNLALAQIGRAHV